MSLKEIWFINLAVSLIDIREGDRIDVRGLKPTKTSLEQRKIPPEIGFYPFNTFTCYTFSNNILNIQALDLD